MLRFADRLSTVPGLARRVLVVEDDKIALAALSRILMMSGYEVLCADSLARAAAQLVWQPDFVLLDLMLPDGSGLDLLARIRRRDEPICVAILSGAGEELMLRAARLRPDAVFRKPIDLGRLLEWLKNPVASAPRPPVVGFHHRGI
jgi:DNA-binding response OmpR family regulator